MIWALLAVALIHGPMAQPSTPYVWTALDTGFAVGVGSCALMGVFAVCWLVRKIDTFSYVGTVTTSCGPPPYLRSDMPR